MQGIISRIEYGGSGFHVSTLLAIAGALGLDVRLVPKE